MQERRAVGLALRANDAAALSAARAEVDAAKVRLGERGPPWWTDDAPITTGGWRVTRHMPTGLPGETRM